MAAAAEAAKADKEAAKAEAAAKLKDKAATKGKKGKGSGSYVPKEKVKLSGPEMWLIWILDLALGDCQRLNASHQLS